MWIRELQLDRNSDRRYRRARTVTQVRSRTVGTARRRRGHDGKLHVRLHRWHAPLMYDETVAFLKEHVPGRPSLAIVLGSGLGGFADEISDRIEIPYAHIPG